MNYSTTIGLFSFSIIITMLCYKYYVVLQLLCCVTITTLCYNYYVVLQIPCCATTTMLCCNYTVCLNYNNLQLSYNVALNICYYNFLITISIIM